MSDPSTYTPVSGPPAPPAYQQAFAYAGTVSGLYGMAVQALGTNIMTRGVSMVGGHAILHGTTVPKGPISAILQNANVQKAFGAVAVALSAYGMYTTMYSMYQKGFSWMGMLQLGMAWFGAFKGFEQMGVHPGAAAIAASGMLVVAAIAAGLVTLFGGGPSSEAVAASATTTILTPVVNTAGPLAMVGVGTIAALFAWNNIDRTPVMASLTMPADYATQVLGQTNGFTNIPLDPHTPSLLVEPATATSPEKVVIISPAANDSSGVPMVHLQEFDLAANLRFVSNCSDSSFLYIPFFNYTRGEASYNQVLVNALSKQKELLEAALSGDLSAQASLSALQIASAADKSCVSPTVGGKS